MSKNTQINQSMFLEFSYLDEFFSGNIAYHSFRFGEFHLWYSAKQRTAPSWYLFSIFRRKICLKYFRSTPKKTRVNDQEIFYPGQLKYRDAVGMQLPNRCSSHLKVISYIKLWYSAGIIPICGFKPHISHYGSTANLFEYFVSIHGQHKIHCIRRYSRAIL